LPAGVTHCDRVAQQYKMGALSGESSGGASCLGPNWVSVILNELGEGPLARQLGQCLQVSSHVCDQCSKSEQYGNVGTRPVQGLICPSAQSPTEDEFLSDFGYRGLAKGNMAACFGSDYFINGDDDGETKQQKMGAFGVVDVWDRRPKPGQSRSGGPTPLSGSKKETVGAWKVTKGVALNQSEFRDGFTRTILISEVISVLSKNDGRGTWAWAGMGGSTFTGRTPPNADGTMDPGYYDKIPICDDKFAEGNRLHCTENRSNGKVWAAARSEHTGIVNVLMADGHTEGRSDMIEPDVWRALTSRKAGDEGSLDMESGL
ncbi:MAG: DUF1559 domain-containing protein, partial [Pirellulales bacterium]